MHMTPITKRLQNKPSHAHTQTNTHEFALEKFCWVKIYKIFSFFALPLIGWTNLNSSRRLCKSRKIDETKRKKIDKSIMSHTIM